MESMKDFFIQNFPVATQDNVLMGTYSSKSISTIRAKKIKYLKLFKKEIGGRINYEPREYT